MMRFPLARASFTFVAFAIGTMTAATASGQQKGFALDRFDPSERGSEWFVLDSLDLRGHKRVAAGGVIGTWAYKPLVAYDANGNETGALVEHQVFIHPGASVVLWSRLRAAVSMPIAAYQTGDAVEARGVDYKAPRSAFGDLRLAADVRVFGKHGDPVTGALGAAVYLPTGSRQNYTSDGTVRLLPRATVAGDVSYFTYSARLGFAYRPLTERFERNPLGSELTAAVAAGVRLANGNLVVGPELFGSSIVDERSFLKRRGTPIEALIGAHYTYSDFRFGGGVGRGITRGWGTPSFRAFLSAEWTPGYDDDTDRDGIANVDDACPSTHGVRTSDPRTNGCPLAVAPSPAPVDRDGDGVVDTEDACPDLAGVRSADARTNGCPPDRDGDGVLDAVDACPDVPGPKSDDPKKNGCLADRDGDGIADEKDACPDVPGAASSDPTAHGCPPDRDGDGIHDKEDACPDVPGPADTDPKRNGCPLARIEGGEIKIVEQIRFKLDSAEILPDSDAILVALAMTLKAHPEIAKLQIQGHTDNRGRAAHNHELSYKRALAVQNWLVRYGIERSRLESKGFGPNRPIESNGTEEGRQNNRRVEFHITEKSGSNVPATPIQR
jgi:OmpA-OmpF porin, OOP family